MVTLKLLSTAKFSKDIMMFRKNLVIRLKNKEVNRTKISSQIALSIFNTLCSVNGWHAQYFVLSVECVYWWGSICVLWCGHSPILAAVFVFEMSHFCPPLVRTTMASQIITIVQSWRETTLATRSHPVIEISAHCH